MPPMKFSKDGRKAKDPKKTLLRLLGYMKHYIPNLVAVLVCIVISAIASTRGSENIGNLVDEFILPMVASGSTDFAPLAKYLVGIGAIFAAGIRCRDAALLLSILELIVGSLHIRGIEHDDIDFSSE